ncbi:TetR/AcrR family transcriptional regulator C-terminal domain-containing protein [Fodinicola feengrottensis]|uniref:TetR/AcrR family transcriptional regulator C-terminal domain-containing protein n=1 Tax=Fodinicola feengrottensis TaxID=435914 RepID=A0ABN2GBH0_9ACTN
MDPVGRPSRGRPPRLSRERIVAAALEFDLESLTMRGLAERLGVTHSTLYGWVSSREELLDLISAVTVDKTLPEGDPVDGDWRGWLTTVAVRMHAELMSAPGHASRLAVTQAHRDAAHDRLHSRAITALAGAGLTPEQAHQTWYIFGVTVLGWIAAEQGQARYVQPASATRLPAFELLLDVLLRGLPPQP